jgi:hypothetical protein
MTDVISVIKTSLAVDSKTLNDMDFQSRVGNGIKMAVIQFYFHFFHTSARFGATLF